jgi:hypothetical protein
VYNHPAFKQNLTKEQMNILTGEDKVITQLAQRFAEFPSGLRWPPEP